MINDSLIPGSNATDLIHGLVNSKFNRNNFKGLQESKDLIRSANIPKSLLGNHILLEKDINKTPSPSKIKATRTPRLINSRVSRIFNNKAKKVRTPVWSPY